MNENYDGRVIDADYRDQMKYYLMENDRFPMTKEEGIERLDTLQKIRCKIFELLCVQSTTSKYEG